MNFIIFYIRTFLLIFFSDINDTTTSQSARVELIQQQLLQEKDKRIKLENELEDMKRMIAKLANNK